MERLPAPQFLYALVNWRPMWTCELPAFIHRRLRDTLRDIRRHPGVASEVHQPSEEKP